MSYVQTVLENLRAKYPWEKEFLQAATEVLESLEEVVEKNPKYKRAKILERIVEPERVIIFRVPWVDDRGEVQVNVGYRVQFNSAIGPYKGGLRFHPSVTLSMLKFLGFEQTLKNSLTTLPMGGGKGGSDFNPTGKSENEIMKFCQSFMTELYRHIGPHLDVPAGDVGVGGREVGYLFGQYKRIVNQFDAATLTGKGMTFGGSNLRPEATGYGAVYFVVEMLKTKGESIKGKTVGVSGFGNVSWGVAKKVTELGAKVISLSGPDGCIIDPDGVGTEEKWNYMLEMRASGRDKVEDYATKFGVKFYKGARPWDIIAMDIAMPCAFQNEVSVENVQNLIKNGCKILAEVSNMGCTAEAFKLANEKMMYAPGKAVNAGGVAVSGLEMSQNSERLAWKAEEVDEKLKWIMTNIHSQCLSAAESVNDPGNYAKGANIAGFLKVAEAMLGQGIV
ncbi:MAG: NADP-specific glutamate dehydrogenase [Candidatus Marinimicrobia bacterium CG08_land_8_20_14_0_20_45_22]|nr:MAG: NADP-specific glutamate dehydrogenase [Candidatus Marinimicrobia bacterium CG08_land_8_20_14_0_20_45_22]